MQLHARLITWRLSRDDRRSARLSGEPAGGSWSHSPARRRPKSPPLPASYVVKGTVIRSKVGIGQTRNHIMTWGTWKEVLHLGSLLCRCFCSFIQKPVRWLLKQFWRHWANCESGLINSRSCRALELLDESLARFSFCVTRPQGRLWYPMLPRNPCEDRSVFGRVSSVPRTRYDARLFAHVYDLRDSPVAPVPLSTLLAFFLLRSSSSTSIRVEANYW